MCERGSVAQEHVNVTFLIDKLPFLLFFSHPSPSSLPHPSSPGYDDENGSYIKVLHDHIAYRYEIREVIGKGSFGQVVKVGHMRSCWVM